MNHFAHDELIRIHHTELRRAADHHRLVTAARGTVRSRRRGVERLRDLLARPVSRRIRAVPEAEPYPP